MRRVKALDVHRRPVRVGRVVGCSRRWRRTELSHATRSNSSPKSWFGDGVLTPRRDEAPTPRPARLRCPLT
eukprot:5145333-Prymnesium_polylepis.1